MIRILDWARIAEAVGLSGNGALAARARAAFEDDAAEVRSLTEGFMNATLPGQAAGLAAWRPILELRDFRLLDVF
jgi:hypothetical protein